MRGPTHQCPSFKLVLIKRVLGRKINVSIENIHYSTHFENISFDEIWKELVTAFTQIESVESVTADEYYYGGLRCSIRKPVTLFDFAIILLNSLREKKWDFETSYVDHEYIARDEKGLSPTDKIQMAIRKTTSS
jgi:hypothetical protein